MKRNKGVLGENSNMELEILESVHVSGEAPASADQSIGIWGLESRGEYPPSSRCHMPSPLTMFERSGAAPFSSNVNDLVTDALLMLAPRAREGVKFECDLHPGRLDTAANPDEVFWLVYYLLRNLLKSMNDKECKANGRTLLIRSDLSGNRIRLEFRQVNEAVPLEFSKPAAFGIPDSPLPSWDEALRRARETIENHDAKVTFQAAKYSPEAITCITIELPGQRQVLT